jgi:hypothetical protein
LGTGAVTLHSSYRLYHEVMESNVSFPYLFMFKIYAARVRGKMEKSWQNIVIWTSFGYPPHIFGKNGDTRIFGSFFLFFPFTYYPQTKTNNCMKLVPYVTK